MTMLPVCKTIVVEAPIEVAFAVFTAEIDSWWPRSHHIGKSDMTRIGIEGRVGGRCFTQHVDGSESDWGRVLVWEPPNRFVFAWHITHEWTHQPIPSHCSEVAVIFTSTADGGTQVEVQHRLFERHGSGGDAMRAAVDAPNGWTLVLAMFARRMSG